MGRFVVVVAILLAMTFVANKYLIQGGDPRPVDPRSIDPQSGASGPDEGAPGAEAEDREAPATDEEESPQLAAAAPPITEEEAVEADAEAAVADAVPDVDVNTDVPAEEVASAAPDIVEATTDVTGEDLSEALPEEEIDILDPSLTAGIPTDGPLTMADIEQWLADVKNHVVLKPVLPLGLRAGQDALKGLEENPLTRAKIELGRQLYFDQRLSSDVSVSCASCHDPDVGFASHDQFGIGVGQQMGGRNSPVAYNRILSDVQFWDGRAATLEEQAKGPIANPIEMSNTHEACVATLRKVPGYVLQFNSIFEDGLTIDNAARAIASFERVLVTGPAPWDVHKELTDFEAAYAVDIEDLDALQEDDPELYQEYMDLKKLAEEHPIGESAIRGGELFFSDKSGCTACHVGANFTDELYHNLGVGMDAAEPDLGRFVITNEEKDRGAFKTPTVRNVALSGPYMHDGSQETLEEVVDWYVKGGHANPWLDEKVKKLELTDQDKKDLVAFMAEGLAGAFPKVERAKLPPDPAAAAENAVENAEAEAEEAVSG